MTKEQFWDYVEAIMVKYDMTKEQACRYLGARGNRKKTWMKQHGIPFEQKPKENKQKFINIPKEEKVTEDKLTKICEHHKGDEACVVDTQVLIYKNQVWRCVGKVEDVLKSIEQPMQLTLPL